MRKMSLAKVDSPVIENVLVRERLFRVLDQARSKRAVWVTGLPGAGKTTLVASYLSAKKVPHAWYHLDSSDADLATFFYYLRYTVKGPTSSRRTRLPFLTPEYLPNIQTFAHRYFQNLYNMLPKGFVLVFDNYHEIDGNPAFHAVIKEAFMSVPEHGNMIVISRARPPAHFIRFKANSTMEVIENESIKFTPEEVHRLMHLRWGTMNGPETVLKLQSLTNGWVAGLVLLLEQHKGHEELIVREGIRDYQSIFEYFSSEIFDRLALQLRDFLLKTSFLPFFTAEMAVRMTGNNSSGKILNDLVRSSFFTVREQYDYYQYHDLFREFLLSRAQDQWTQKELGEVRHRAATILENAGFTEEAARLFLLSEHWSEAVRVILRHASTFVLQGRYRTLESWLKGLPGPVVQGNPWLIYWLGACRLPFSPAESYPIFKRAFRLFSKNKDRNGVFMAWTGISDSITYGFGKMGLHDPWIAVMERLVKQWKGFPSTKTEEAAVIRMFHAMNFRHHFSPRIRPWLQHAVRLFEKTDDIDMRMQLCTVIAVYYSTVGNILMEETVLPSLRDLKFSNQLSPLTYLMFKIVEVLYNYYTAADDPEFKALNEGIRVAEMTGIHVLDPMLLTMGTGWALSSGDAQLTRKLLRKLSRIADSAGDDTRAFYAIVTAGEAMAREDFTAAYAIQKAGLEPAVGSGDVNLIAISSLQMSQILHELSDDAAAQHYLNRTSRTCAKQKHFQFMYLIVKALYAFDLHDDQTGLRSLRKAMQLGQDKGYVNFPGWRPSVMARLCVKALEQGINSEYVRGLIKKRRLVPGMLAMQCENWPWQMRISTLGGLRILRDDAPVELSRKAQVKPLELLQFLIVNHGRPVGPDQISSALWPDAEGDYALQALDTTLHRLRRLLGHNDAVLSQAGRLVLNTKVCWVDAIAFEFHLDRMDAVATGKVAMPRVTEMKDTINAAFGLYRGHFFCEADLSSWAIRFRDRLHDRFLRFIEQAGRYYEGIGDQQGALSVYQKGLEMDDRMELFYQRLMAIYRHLGRYAEAASLYGRCAAALDEAFGIEPSERTKGLYRGMKP